MYSVCSIKIRMCFRNAGGSQQAGCFGGGQRGPQPGLPGAGGTEGKATLLFARARYCAAVINNQVVTIIWCAKKDSKKKTAFVINSANSSNHFLVENMYIYLEIRDLYFYRDNEILTVGNV